jgi:hypothetical protein
MPNRKCSSQKYVLAQLECSFFSTSGLDRLKRKMTRSEPEPTLS